MSEFLEDPSILTKDKLKSELLANNVALPSGEHRKDVYVQLYLNNLTVQNKKKVPLDAFSSDEELPPPLVSNKSRSGRKATRKTDKPRVDEVDVTDLTDEDLKDQLLKYGVSIGPIVASTRKLYEKKLQKMLERGPPEATPPLSAPTKIDSNQNGNTDSDQYSDKEEEERTVPEPEPEPELEPEPEPVPVVEKHVSRGKTPQRTRRQEYNREQAEDHLVLNVKRRQRRSSLRLDQTVPAGNNIALTDPDFLLNGVLQERIGQLASKSSKPYPLPKVEDRLVAGDQVSVVGEKDFLKEMFPNEVTTPTGISATCRRPIRGAAGRPLKASDFWIDESRLRRSERIETSSSFSESRTVLRAAAPLLSSSSSSSLVTAPSGGQVRTRRSLPVWVQLLLLSAVAGFLFFVYQAMETNKLNPFGSSDSPAPIAAGDGADQAPSSPSSV